jgi:alkylation response protein AidB-like acyl-CoA dehydrogenase
MTAPNQPQVPGPAPVGDARTLSGISAREQAESLDEFLGGFWTSGSRLSVPQVLSTEEGMDLPWPAFDALHEWGLHRFLVPDGFGGRLTSLEELFQLFRTISRRDIRIVVALGSGMLGANPVWLWGSDPQRRWLAERVLAGELGSFGMSERDHGSDLAGCTFTAQRRGDKFYLTGEKWPIGNGNRGSFVTVYAQTGPGSFSLLLVDKTSVPKSKLRALPMVGTLGMRGHDLSGLTFDDCPVPVSAVIGGGGAGIAQTLKTLQITRTIIAATSLGALDTALRICLQYTQERRLYGSAIESIPVIRDTLTRVYLDILIGECASLPAARALAVLPERLSLWSSIVKYLVPVMADEDLAQLATVLSARYYLQDTERSRLFQKIQRDHAVVGIFEGTTHVNLSVIARHLASLAESREPGESHDDVLLSQLFSVDGTSAIWHPDGNMLTLISSGPDPAVRGWSYVKDQVARCVTTNPVHAELLDVVNRVDALWSEHQRRVAELNPGSMSRTPARGFSEARVFALLYAAAACVLTWWHSKDNGALAEPFNRGEWVVLALWRILQRLDSTVTLPERHAEAAAQWMFDQHMGDRSFSVAPTRLLR